MKIHEYDSVAAIIEAHILEQDALGSKITHSYIADSLRIQKSYFSKLMSGGAHFTQDHGFLLSKIMDLNESEFEFLNLIIDRDRAGVIELTQMINKKIKKLRVETTKSEDYLSKNVTNINSNDLGRYYLYPETQLIHLSLALQKFQENPEQLMNIFSINEEIFKQSIKILQELKLIEVKNNRVELIKSNLHLPKDSPFFHQWQLQMKLKSLEKIKSLDSEDKYNFIVSFTASDEDREKIRIEFMKFLEKIEKTVQKAESKHLYQMNFDLFKWT